jgi:hypothetical protein
MNIQALNIKVGDCIIAYCKNKRQACTVKQLLETTPNNITLKVSTSVPVRESAFCVVQFHREALVELAFLQTKTSSQTEP